MIVDIDVTSREYMGLASSYFSPAKLFAKVEYYD